MKSYKNVFLMVFAIGLVLSMLPNHVRGELLIEYSSGKDGTKRYYDRDSVKKSGGVVKIWTKNIYGDDSDEKKSKIKALKENNACDGCDQLSFNKTLVELNCKDDLYRFSQHVEYATDGSVIISRDEPSEWEDIVPGSVIDYLKNKACRIDANSSYLTDGSKWITVGKNEFATLQYNPKSISYSKKTGVTSVWTKTIPSQETIESNIKSGLLIGTHSYALSEWKCKKKEKRIVEIIKCDGSDVLGSITEVAEWRAPLIPLEWEEYKAVCASSKRKK